MSHAKIDFIFIPSSLAPLASSYRCRQSSPTEIVPDPSELLINEEFLLQHPLADQNFFEQLSATTKSLTISGLQKNDELHVVLSRFPSVQSLTLENINASKQTESLTSFPKAITSLKFVKCSFSLHFLGIWFRHLKKLQSMHSIDGHYEKCRQTTTTVCLCCNRACLKVSHLILEGDTYDPEEYRLFYHKADLESYTLRFRRAKGSTWFYCISTKVLSISIDDLNGNLSLEFPMLQHYSLASPQWRTHRIEPANLLMVEIVSSCPSTLESLILPACPEEIDFLIKCTALKTLTITEPVESAKQIEMMKTLQRSNPRLMITYSVNPDPKFNQIFSLNDDCLLLIFSQLRLNDLVTMSVVDRRFEQLMDYTATFKGTFVVDEEFLEKFPLETSMEIYKLIGARAKKMRFTISVEHFQQVMPYLTVVEDLDVADMKLSKLRGIQNFPRVRTLRLTGVPSSKVEQRLLKHLNANLRHLQCLAVTDMKDIWELQNLQTLGLGGVNRTIGLENFFARNNKLDTLKLEEFKTFNVDLTRIARLEKLKKLHIKGPAILILVLYRLPLFKHVEDLLIYNCKSIAEFLSAFPSLKTLSVYYSETPSACFERLAMHKRLEKLVVIGRSSFTEGEAMGKVTTLKSVTFNCDCAQMTLEIIQKLPNLVEMSNKSLALSIFQRQFVLEFLREKKRVLRYNGSEFGWEIFC